MSDKPMTLRERIERDLESLCDNEMDILTVIAETAAIDAERDRLARIGELVEGLYNTLTIDDHLTIAHEGMGGVWITHSKGRGTESQADSLLDALESLAKKMEGK